MTIFFNHKPGISMNPNDEFPNSSSKHMSESASLDSAKKFQYMVENSRKLKVVINTFKSEFPFLVVKVKE